MLADAKLHGDHHAPIRMLELDVAPCNRSVPSLRLESRVAEDVHAVGYNSEFVTANSVHGR